MAITCLSENPSFELIPCEGSHFAKWGYSIENRDLSGRVSTLSNRKRAFPNDPGTPIHARFMPAPNTNSAKEQKEVILTEVSHLIFTSNPHTDSINVFFGKEEKVNHGNETH